MTESFRVVVLGACCWVVLASGCNSNPSSEQRARAGQLSHAIDRLRQAPNSEKAQRLELLKALSCAEKALCETQAVCVSAYELHVGATEALAKLGHQGGVAPQEIGRVRKQLERARKAMKQCVTSQAALQQRFGVD